MKAKDAKENENIERLENKYPVEQFATENAHKVTEKEVEEAVKEINPDKDSLGSRG